MVENNFIYIDRPYTTYGQIFFEDQGTRWAIVFAHRGPRPMGCGRIITCAV